MVGLVANGLRSGDRRYRAEGEGGEGGRVEGREPGWATAKGNERIEERGLGTEGEKSSKVMVLGVMGSNALGEGEC